MSKKITFADVKIIDTVEQRAEIASFFNQCVDKAESLLQRGVPSGYSYYANVAYLLDFLFVTGIVDRKSFDNVKSGLDEVFK